jgi:hypothetical protein
MNFLPSFGKLKTFTSCFEPDSSRITLDSAATFYAWVATWGEFYMMGLDWGLFYLYLYFFASCFSGLASVLTGERATRYLSLHPSSLSPLIPSSIRISFFGFYLLLENSGLGS